CVYDRTTQRSIVSELWNELVPPTLTRIDAGASIDDALQSIRESMLARLPFVAASIKHPSFSEEQEWRIVTGYVSFDDDRLSYFPRNSIIVPYMSIDLTPVPNWLESVTVGPNPHQEVAKNALSKFLTSCRLGTYSCPRSQIPFRSL